MRKKLGLLFKCIIAGIISIILLSVFSLIYYNPPVAIQQSDFITNFKFRENSNWSYMLEGFGYGVTDKLGYNNAYYTDCTEADIVFVGSSHLEALQVPQNANCVYLLNEKFDKDTLLYNNFKCLNLSVSANAFEVSVSNFPYILEKYNNAKTINDYKIVRNDFNNYAGYKESTQYIKQCNDNMLRIRDEQIAKEKRISKNF